MDLRENTIKYGRLVVFMIHGLALGIGILIGMASSVYFMRFFCALLRRSLSCFPCSPYMILTY